MDTQVGQDHSRKLDHMYHALAVSRLLEVNLTVEAGSAVIECSGRDALARADGHEDAHCFRMISDAALFAASSIETECALETVDFNVRFLSRGTRKDMLSNRLLVHKSWGLFFAQAELFDQEGRCLAVGSGTLRLTETTLASMMGYG
ncbi:hypothetical protein [Pseudoxanthomonas sp. Root65]|uniref:hypothetical protein n=1 Tax=Pseudoxanthomonas sp. Root65 TaxID=1736576 RepID=UPI0012E3512A|nr:hypothetical protein [Pseudoxanthomonas sp. Root65]